jgi:hypothetical protein
LAGGTFGLMALAAVYWDLGGTSVRLVDEVLPVSRRRAVCRLEGCYTKADGEPGGLCSYHRAMKAREARARRRRQRAIAELPDLTAPPFALQGACSGSGSCDVFFSDGQDDQARAKAICAMRAASRGPTAYARRVVRRKTYSRVHGNHRTVPPVVRVEVSAITTPS